ncbi:hypothetical protein [Streptomyces sp. NPDC001843]|uniref:hypothetical protein n=1 Tax=Streptomyces sp. NPDC001843 TaxID=3364617 RepID=UPI00369E8A42
MARQAALGCDDPGPVARAAALWARPAHLRERRCAELVSLDATFATMPFVPRTLAIRRTATTDDVPMTPDRPPTRAALEALLVVMGSSR